VNRRTSVKSILGLGVLGISSFSIFRWIGLHQKLDLQSLLSYKVLITDLAETIIPKTDTPGAKEAGVENYIINVLTNCTGRIEQNKFLNGLADLEEYTQDNFGKTFKNCTAADKVSILSYFENKDKYSVAILNKVNNKFLGRSFFTQLKNLTIEGYCTSQIGATQGLAYDFIPSTFQSCIPLTAHQKSWATK